jgi:coiled-coil and C2 domain-containing protein 2A
MWQLDLSLAGLIFTHHPLFSREHVLAQNLLELHELYHKKRQMPDATTALQGKVLCNTKHLCSCLCQQLQKM